jgi:hypothetical protein
MQRSAPLRYPLSIHLPDTDTDTDTDKFQHFLGVLLEQGVDLQAVRMFATGGRGYHIEVPQEIFLPKPAKPGIPRLPLIYREMAYELYVDPLDLRVYSTRKGRMWRTVGVKRENGKFKVPITGEGGAEQTNGANYTDRRTAPPVATARIRHGVSVGVGARTRRSRGRDRAGIQAPPEWGKNWSAD